MNKTYQELCDENQRLRDGIRSMATALEGGEWKDTVFIDPDLHKLEVAIFFSRTDRDDALGVAIKALNAALLVRNGRARRDAECREKAIQMRDEAVMRARRDWAAQASPEIKAQWQADGAEAVRDRLREKASKSRRQSDSDFYHRCANVANHKADDIRRQAEGGAE
ncbi:hypothetical protein [Chromohalobacter sp. 296-RDG]|uniref:hypothetical protein n=1 Tax=Chromohalobacter sp. 296-RDG TaxID=2994062 RepID=UPI002468E4F9|nr:hypothetical protein [Chromohalobacter sp. 296-RDG]